MSQIGRISSNLLLCIYDMFSKTYIEMHIYYIFSCFDCLIHIVFSLIESDPSNKYMSLVWMF